MTDEERKALVSEATQAALAQTIRMYEEQVSSALKKLEHLNPPKTYADLSDAQRKWLEGKSEKDLKELDETIEFFTSSRAAGKILVWVGGIAITAIGSAVTFAKYGWDLFSWTRNLPR